MRIGELSRRTGVSQRALRYYEEQGLLRPSRRASGYREYADTDVETVRRIRILLAAGLGTSTIAEILPCILDSDDGLAPGCPELRTGLAQERDRLSAAIDQLQSARTALEGIITTPTPPSDTSDPAWTYTAHREQPNAHWR
ncbi:MerR family transcriptional regulator [Actinopolymorpha alba]|uniref:MerR family transcriptional regulator n=1 Tax=Actinopolymorpha alba TaxID=533267 RepID=UPI0003754EDA|nr:MerR family transcriptional regulator [Actinopolymorpha alba]